MIILIMSVIILNLKFIWPLTVFFYVTISTSLRSKSEYIIFVDVVFFFAYGIIIAKF